MDNALYIVESLTYFLSKITDCLSAIILVIGIGLFTFLILRPLILFLTCLWRRDPRWRDYGFEILMISDFFRIAYVIGYHADQAVDKIEERADLIDQALSEGKDPYKVVKDAGL